MASGLSLIKDPPRSGTIYYTKDGSPLRRATPKVRMSKKERRKMRAVAKASAAAQDAVKDQFVEEVLRGKA